MTGMRPQDILTPVPAGLYCRSGNFHIDPVRAVPRALITHGHSDHARAGHGAVLATPETLDIMALRYGANFCETRQPIRYGETVRLSGVTASYHPAGHVLGSAQIKLVGKSGCVVISGDYKRAHDPTCEPFELIRCDAFVTEATFGLPVFRHPVAAHLVGAYSLGKAQRVMKLIREAGWDRTIWIHGAVEKITAFYQEQGIDLGDVRKVAATD